MKDFFVVLIFDTLWCFFFLRFLFYFLTIMKDMKFGLGNAGVFILLEVSIFLSETSSGFFPNYISVVGLKCKDDLLSLPLSGKLKIIIFFQGSNPQPTFIMVLRLTDFTIITS